MKHRTQRFHLVLVACGILAGLLVQPRGVAAWGTYGHEISGRAAARKLPREMPSFFRGAAEQLAYLNGEPDRWRDKTEAAIDPALNAAAAMEHYIHFEHVPAGALREAHRYNYLKSLQAAGTDAADAGLLPYRILELFQRLRVEFRLWRAAQKTGDGRTRKWLEQRIINDAGLLGHYVTDGSNPHHTSIHTEGWVGDNPEGYTTDKSFHGRFEKVYVDSHIKQEDLSPLIDDSPHVVADPRAETIDFLKRSHALVETLYRIEKRATYDEKTLAPENKRFALERLAAGALMLRDLWWTAWVTSAPS